MAIKKTTKKVVEAEKEVEVCPVADTPVNKEFEALLEKYKIQNPAKYELKKAELLAKLNK